MGQLIKTNNFLWLVIAMIGLLLGSAFSRDVPDSFTIQLFEFGGVILLLVSLFSLKTRQTWSRRLFVIIALMLIVAIASAATGLYYMDVAYLALLLVFMLAAAWLVGGHVLLSDEINFNRIMGAVALYLILGLIWSVLYTAVLEVWPDALQGIEPGLWHQNMPVMTYFSFVTLTTLGYGDISPLRPIAEVLVILEAITGIFYLAIIVASLVGAMRVRQLK